MPSRLGLCIGHLSFAVIRRHDQSSVREREFTWAYAPVGESTAGGTWQQAAGAGIGEITSSVVNTSRGNKPEVSEATKSQSFL